jgi:small ligand-binding sensory domain FIST
MGAFASSFEVRTDSPSAVAAGLLSALTEVQRPAFALVFCSGKLTARMGELAQALRSKADVPIVLASGPGVLSERRELEGESAATGIACAGKAPVWSICPHDETLTQERLGAVLGQPVPGESVLLFLRSEGFNPQLLWQLRQTHPSPALLGAGTHGEPGLLCVRGQEVVRASAVALRLSGFGKPSIYTAHSCRLLAPPMAITG